MLKAQWIAKDKLRDCGEAWETRPQWDDDIVGFVQAEGELRGTLFEDDPDWLKPYQLWEREEETERPDGELFQNNRVAWSGFWWRKIEDNSRECWECKDSGLVGKETVCWEKRAIVTGVDANHCKLFGFRKPKESNQTT